MIYVYTSAVLRRNIWPCCWLKLASPVLHHRSTRLSWSLTLRDEHRVRLFESRVLRETIGAKTGEVTGGGEDYTTKHVASVAEKVHMRLWCGKLTERNHLENLGVDGKIMLNYIQEVGWTMD